MKKINIIIPCFNEEEALPQLFEKLRPLSEKLDGQYDFTYYFIDDGSSDQTYPMLSKYCDENSRAQVLKHEVNKNLGAALKTGIYHHENPETCCDYFLFLDSDCTYEPEIILELLKHLDNNFDLVTVSPYHPQGNVEGVPEWRLFLSKGLTFIYRLVLRKTYFTFTAMVRGIRADKITSINSDSNDFSFVAEMFIKAVLRNYKIIEVPTTLYVRKYGQSKMNIIKTIKSHLKIIKKLLTGNLK